MNKNNKTTLFVNSGAILEYFDFIIFPYLLPYISSVFFSEDRISSFIKILLLNAAGSVSKVFGVFILGALYTMYGSAYVMVLSIYMMSISTFLIGLIPSYSKIGYLAPGLLLLLRFVQGVAYSIELPASSTFIFDHYKNKEGKKISYLLVSTTLGAIIALLLISCLVEIFGIEGVKNGIWRVPFIIAGLVGFYALYIRLSVLPKTKIKLATVTIREFLYFIKTQKRNVLESALYILLPAFMVVTYIFLPKIITSKFNFSHKIAYIASLVGLIFSVITSIFTGYIPYKSHMKYFKRCTVLFLLVYPLSWLLLNLYSFWGLIAFVCIFQYFLTTFMMLALYKINTTFSGRYRGVLTVSLYNLAFVISNIIPVLNEYYNPICLATSLPAIVCATLLIFFAQQPNSRVGSRLRYAYPATPRRLRA